MIWFEPTLMFWAVPTLALLRRMSEPTDGTWAGLPSQSLAVFQLLSALLLVQMFADTELRSTFWISWVEVREPVPAVKPMTRLEGRVYPERFAVKTVWKTPLLPNSTETVSWFVLVSTICIVSAWEPDGRVVWPG